ncbi:GNAT family N-acetyltransferase [Staphylococcus sp. SQ8-PEA]|uniref:GNAT family N-acetyltransferase n=1 Tax=Staphylococcus marylandisciuri TaxID=2981529 RepID=A0ABT2QMU7_9STAP|nr:GNAT family N-acetyltransferase [Staphylococcus marylandisciuri]MCU5745287.1 GNAT family N-acetyltransferase [Staphylococcus marylandisciuri]
MTTLNIRVAVEEDVEELYYIMHQAFTPLRELGINWPSVNADRSMIRDNLCNTTMFVLEDEEKILSTISVRYPWEARKSVATYPFVWWFATRPECEGKGYGSYLLKYVEETFLRDTLKVPAVTLGTSGRLHPWLLNIYKRRGYKVYKERETKEGDLGILMYKTLIPEQFDENNLQRPTS